MLRSSNLNRTAKKDSKMNKCFIFFKPDVLVVAKDSAGKNITDNILYKSIKCINLLGKSSFYFKSNKDGYALFFKNHNPENAKKWFKYLIMCKDKTDDAKIDLQPFDLGDNVPSVKWMFKEAVYKFNYRQEIGDKKDKSSSENPAPGEIWISDLNRTKFN